MQMPERWIYKSFQIDTNRINGKNALEHMNRLEKWHRDGVIRIDMSEVAHDEARAGRNRTRSAKAMGYIFSMTYANTAGEQGQMRTIESILFPQGAATKAEKNDVEIVFNALKYGRILVTADGGSRSQPGGILGNADKLRQLGVHVMRDSEAVDYIEAQIRRRDKLAHEIAQHTGQPLPTWVDQD